MEFNNLKDKALSLDLSEDALKLVTDIASFTHDPLEAAIIGLSCGMLATKEFIEEVIGNE